MVWIKKNTKNLFFEDKGGAFGHIEMILSFILFLGFLLFLFIFFNPVKKTQLSEFDLNFAGERIIGEITEELNYTSFGFSQAVLQSITQDCFSLDFNSDGNVYVKDEAGAETEANHDSNKVYIKRSDKRFFYIYFFREFAEGNLMNCYDLDTNDKDYELGVKRTMKVIYNADVAELVERYNDDYEGLRKELGISSEFGFTIYDSQKKEKLFEAIKQEVGVSFAKEEGFQMLDSSGELKYAILNIKVW